MLNVSAQIIKGTVSDVNEAVPFANIVVKKHDKPETIIKYTVTDENGQYEIILPSHRDSLLVEVTSPQHEIQQQSIFSLRKDEPTILDFILQKRTTSLKEVIVKAKEKPVTIKGDTTTYNPDSFKDGSEKVIEDLLKKLPGIKVDADGGIKYKGRSIKKMLLDGDDLFDVQYRIGSKNISIEMVDKVQAIEDFNENPLLKGIRQSDEVALNIKLKKGKTDFSGSSKIGYGVKDRYDSSVSGLLINSKSKSFGLVSYNNIGFNPSPYNINSEILDVESQNEANLAAKEIIRQGRFYSPLPNQYSNINKNLYSSANSLFKVSEKIVSRVNVGFYSDELSRITNNESVYTINGNTTIINESESAKKQPNIFNANLQLLNKNPKNDNWEYLGKLKIQKVDFDSESNNNGLNQTNIVEARSFLTTHKFNYSTLLDDKTVLIVSTLFSKSNAPQDYSITPGINTDGNSSVPMARNNQNSRFSKENLTLNSELFGKFDNFKWALRNGALRTTNYFESSLILTDVNGIVSSDDSYVNRNRYTISMGYSDYDMTFTHRKFSIKAGIGLKYYDLRLTDYFRDLYKDANEFVFSPTIKFVHKISKKSSFLYNYSYNQLAPQESNLFEGLVQTGYRTFQNNLVDLDFLKTHNLSVGYNYSGELNLNRLMLIASYSRGKNNYFTRTVITPNTTTLTSFLLNTQSDTYNLSASSGTYIHAIRTTIDFDANYAVNLYKDIVNDSGLRNVVSKVLNLELTMRRGIRKVMYFETKTLFLSSIFLLEKQRQNQFNSLNQDLKIAYNSGKSFKANATLSFVASDLSINNDYWFLNSEVSFSSRNKKIDYSLIARNLINNKTFDTFSINDFSSSRFSQNLIERYLLANVSFNF
ncbi:carboxypeptidase regulatory-like domain-containing protein [Flavobacterium sp.]